MAKMLPAGTVNTPWKRLPTGVWVPGFPQVPSGRQVLAIQDLMQACFLAAGSKPVILCSSADFAVKEQTAAGRCNRVYTIASTRQDWTQPNAATQPAYVASEPTIGGRGMLQCAGGTRHFLNAINLPAPSVQTFYRKSVCRLDSWPPGARCWIGSTSNRFGVYTRSTPDSILLANTANSLPVDQPLSRWGVLTYCLRNSAAAYPNGDFIQFGTALNRATGISAGNTDPASLGKFANNGGTQGVVGSEAFEMVWTQALTDAESRAVDTLLNAYYGSGLLIFSSSGNIRSAGVGFLGSSQTRGDPVYAYAGARFSFWNQYGNPAGLNYPTWTSGHTTNGTWAQPQHDGVSGLGVDIDTAGPLPGAGLASAILYFSPSGGSANAGAGSYRWIQLELGGADVLGGTYVPVTTAANLLNIAVNLATANPLATIAINTIAPQLGNPPGTTTFSAEIRDPGGVWDQFDALFPVRPCNRVDLNFAVSGGTGLYNAANYIDTVHLNLTGQQLWGTEIIAKSTVSMNLATTY